VVPKELVTLARISLSSLVSDSSLIKITGSPLGGFDESEEREKSFKKSSTDNSVFVTDSF
jgi:hypothetical protein